MAAQGLRLEPPPTEDEINQILARLAVAFDVGPESVVEAVKLLHARFRIRMDVPQRGWIDPACGAMFWTEAAWLDEPPTPQSITSKLGLQIDPRTLQAAKLEWVDQDSRKQYSMLMRIPAPCRQ